MSKGCAGCLGKLFATIGFLVVLVVCVIVFLAYMGDGHRRQARELQQSSTGQRANRIRVTQEQFGDRWPLTVDAGEIECIDGFLLVFHYEDATYALNGAAISRGYPEIDPIWKDRADGIAPKENIGPLLKAGRALLD